MANLEILTNQNPILRKTSKPVAKITKEIRELVENMEETLRAAPGVGLDPEPGRLPFVVDTTHDVGLSSGPAS